MKVACLLITHLRAKVEMRRHSNLKNIAAIIIERSRGRSQVVDSTPSASGVSPGDDPGGGPIHPTPPLSS